MPPGARSPFWAVNRKSPAELLAPLIDINRKIDAVADWRYVDGSWLFRMYLQRLSRVSFERMDDLLMTMTQPVHSKMFSRESERLDGWTDCVTLASRFARSKHLPILFFLQPNQYVAGSKPFSEEEKKWAFSPSDSSVVDRVIAWSGYRVTKEGLTRTYHRWEERIGELRERGVPVYTALCVRSRRRLRRSTRTIAAT